MNKLFSAINFIKNQRKVLISVFLTTGILSAMVDVLIVFQHPKIFKSNASSPYVVFKNASGQVLFVNKDNIPTSESPEVIIELNPSKQPRSYKVSETPNGLAQMEPKPYQPPVKFAYQFKNIHNNLSTLFVEFLYSDGSFQKVTSSIEINSQSVSTPEFISSANFYKLPYDKRLWGYEVKPDQDFGSRVIFTLNKEYGFARLDIIEGESQKDLASLTDEIIKKSILNPPLKELIQFKGKPAYLVTYTEKVLGQDTYFYQQIVKSNNKFLIFEKRFPKLGDSQNYLDNLLRSISLEGDNPSKVKGVSGYSTTLTTAELVDLVRPSIASIAHSFCVEINNLAPDLSKLSQAQYNFCGVSKGSGFIVNEKGIVATNGHVAKIYPEEGLITNLPYEGGKAFALDLIRNEDFYSQLNSNPQYLDRFLTEIFSLIDKKAISLNITSEKYYVNMGSEPIKVDQQTVIPSATTYTASLIDFDYPNRYSADSIIRKVYPSNSDVALLKIENSPNLFPALSLGMIDNLKEGQDVIVVGYPTLVEGGDNPGASISYKTSQKPTVTRGIVSSIKQDASGRTIIQTDASIDHGNSGGPAFDSSASVIGIATFMLESQSGHFNFLRSVSDLKELMSKNKIDNKQADLTSYWKKGLDSYKNRQYGKAIEYFEKVEKLSPTHPTVKEFIESSKKAITKGESLEGLTGFVKNEKNSNIFLIIFGGVSLVSFMSAGFLTILPLFAKEETNTPYI